MRTVTVAILTVVSLALSGALTAQTPTPSPTPIPALPMPSPGAGPAISELTKLRVTNALLKANLADQQYRAVMAESTAIVRAEVATFETDHPGWTLDASKLIAVKKPEPKK